MRFEDVDRESIEWREASTLLVGYLHQDFDLVHGDAWSAVRAYADESSDDERTAGAASVRRLLLLDDEALEKVADRFGMAYYPPGDGYSSYRYWLSAVADHLEDPVAHPGPPERDAPLPTTEGAGGRVSTFTDREVAERAVAENLESNRSAIEVWRRAAGPNRAFECRHGEVIGRLAPPEATLDTIHDVDRSRVILRRTDQTTEGWFVMVSYPISRPDPMVAAAIDRTAPGWEALWSLLGGYLHQDFDIHGGSAGAIAAFEADAREGQREAAGAAIRRLLGGGDEAYLAAATEWLGMDYHPPGDGRSYREWLTVVADRLER